MRSSFNYIIVEDQPLQQENLIEMLSERLDLKLLDTFDNAEEAYAFLAKTKGEQADLMFLDIELPNQHNGINLLAAIQKFNLPMQVIITSAHLNYAPEGYEYNVSSYLLKPLEKGKLEKALKKALTNLVNESNSDNQLKSKATNSEKENFISLKANAKLVKVFHKEIIMCEGDGVYVKVITPNHTYRPRETMRNLEKTLAHSGFYRIHDSFIINEKYLRSLAKNFSSLELKHPEMEKIVSVPIGKKYRNDLKKVAFFDKFLSANS